MCIYYDNNRYDFLNSRLLITKTMCILKTNQVLVLIFNE